jgi:biopolymer transport protein ExbD
MVTASLRKAEADIGLSLPGIVQQSHPLQMPDEQIIEIDAEGRVTLNNTAYGSPSQRELPQLLQQLARYRVACRTAGTKALVTIQAVDKTKHQRIIDVMNACAGAGIRNVTFGLDE